MRVALGFLECAPHEGLPLAARLVHVADAIRDIGDERVGVIIREVKHTQIVAEREPAEARLVEDARLLVVADGSQHLDRRVVLGIGLADTLYFRALNRIGAARMGVAGTAFSPSVILLAAIFLGERLSLVQLAGVAITLGGIALVTYVKSADHLDARTLRNGALLGIASVAVMAAGVVIAKPVLETQDFLWVVFLRVVGGFAVMSLFLLQPGRAAGLVAAYRGVRHWPYVIAGSLMGTYISMLFWLAGYKYADASIAAVLNELSAIFIVLLAAWLLHDRLQRRQIAGCALAVVGVLVVVAGQ